MGRFLLLALCVSGVLVVACGGGDDDAAEPASDDRPAADGDQPDGAEGTAADEVWVGNLEGAPTVVEIGIPPSEAPELGPVETFRELVGAPPIRYVRVTVDNTDADTENHETTGDLNGGDGTDPVLTMGGVCTYLFLLDLPLVSEDDMEEQVAAMEEARQAAFDSLGCEGAGPIPAGSEVVFWLHLDSAAPPIETLELRFNEFSRQ